MKEENTAAVILYASDFEVVGVPLTNQKAKSSLKVVHWCSYIAVTIFYKRLIC
jgi:hypothetical protein